MCTNFYLKSPIIDWSICTKALRINRRELAEQCPGETDVKTHLPVVHHELLHSQQSIVADLLVFMVHVVHHKLLSTELLNNPAEQKRLCEDVISFKLMQVTSEKSKYQKLKGFLKPKLQLTEVR